MLGVPKGTLIQWCRRGSVEYARDEDGQLGFSQTMADQIIAQINEGELMITNKSIEKGKARRTFPPKGDHVDMVLVDDPTGELIIGYGRYEFGSWKATCLDGSWPEGSVWRGERGSAPDTLYQVIGFGVKKLTSYSRHGRISSEQ